MDKLKHLDDLHLNLKKFQVFVGQIEWNWEARVWSKQVTVYCP